MIYIKYFFAALAVITFKLLCWITSPFNALVAATFKLEKLPGIWSWVHTHDDNIYGDDMTNDDAANASFVKRYKAALWWLFRNPGYGFSAFVTGYPAVIVDRTVPQGLHKFTAADGSKLFSYKKDKLWLGWKPYSLAGRHMIIFRFWK